MVTAEVGSGRRLRFYQCQLAEFLPGVSKMRRGQWQNPREGIDFERLAMELQTSVLARITRTHYHILLFYIGTGDQNSHPGTCTASILLT